MKVATHLLAAMLAASVLASTACQTARPAALLPPAQANAPALIAQPRQDATPNANLQQPEESAPALRPDPVVVLIASVDKDYQSGQDNLKAGNLESARQNFNEAFDLLMASPLDIHSDPRLVVEFNRVVAGLNNLDSSADQSTDNALAQKSEPAPIDETNEVTPPVDANVKAKAAAEVKFTRSDLPLMMTDPVAAYINYFSGRGRGVLERGLIRDGRYDAMIRRILKEEQVPQELIYLAQAESGFHPLALSRVGARGMWQFMASRAQGYGLQHTQWVDERQDPEKSTRAAARHLRDLYKQFGDWYLAMAAYNSGPGTVQQAVKRTGYVDFWELYKRDVLPKETRNYVPIILAVTIMAKNPAQYGLDKLDRDEPVPYDVVKIDYPVDLRLAAECVGARPEILQDLNPSLLRWTTPKDDQPFELHLPAGTKDQYATTISAIPPDMRVWWRLHTVVQGDTLASIARSYRTSTQSLVQANDIEANSSLLPDSQLIVPISAGRHASSEDAVTYARHITIYKVRKGDTVQSVAENFDVSTLMVRRWNHLRGESLGGRRMLYIHMPVAPNAFPTPHVISDNPRANPKSSNTLQAKSGNPVVHHKVAPGETLTSIAVTHHTTVQALKHDNGVVTLRPGMVLIIRASR